MAGIAAWPQDLLLPPADHSLHPLVEVPEGEPLPSMSLRLTRDRMDGFNLYLDTTNFRFTPQNLGGTIIANEGHAHLYVNGEKVARMYSPWHHLSEKALRPGINRIEVEFSANDHSVWGAAGQPIGTDVLIDTREQDGDPILREAVRYTLDWDWDGAAKVPSGGWETRNDLGYTVRVEAGRLVTRNLELVPCHWTAGAGPQARLMEWLRPATAWAGHSSLMPNESKISSSQEEDLASPARSFLETRTVTDPEYCKAHYLIARPTGSGPGTLAMEASGTWNRSGQDAGNPFRIQSAAAYGQILGLTDSSGGAIDRRLIVGGIDLTVRRSLATMFDSIEFASGEPDRHGMQAMRNLVSDTKIEVASD